MNEAKILNAIADTMTCNKCTSPCKAKQNASKASCVQQWSEILSKINPNANWKEVRYEVSEMQRPKSGKWKNIVDGIEYAWGTCDTCGARIPMAYKYYEYCPHCGMKNEVTE